MIPFDFWLKRPSLGLQVEPFKPFGSPHGSVR